MRTTLLSGPAVEPVSLAHAKSWLRIDGADEDDLLISLILSARLTLEAHTRRRFLTQSWRMFLDDWPKSGSAAIAPVAIPSAPFQAVSAIRVYDDANAANILASGSYSAPAANDLARVTFLTTPPSPVRSTDGIEIDIVAGYGDHPEETPEPLRCAILMLVAQWHENRGDAQTTTSAIPASVEALVNPFRRRRLK
jgi:uncharacterized phiE125 gp8 family phage protein